MLHTTNFSWGKAAVCSYHRACSHEALRKYEYTSLNRTQWFSRLLLHFEASQSLKSTEHVDAVLSRELATTMHPTRFSQVDVQDLRRWTRSIGRPLRGSESMNQAGDALPLSFLSLQVFCSLGGMERPWGRQALCLPHRVVCFVPSSSVDSLG